MISLRRGLLLAVAVGVLGSPTSAGAQALSFEFYKANVQPIFLKKRVGHTRCIVCHAGANNAMRLTPLERGASDFTDEQSKTNFETSCPTSARRRRTGSTSRTG